jgi:hypothetical protein
MNANGGTAITALTFLPPTVVQVTAYVFSSPLEHNLLSPLNTICQPLDFHTHAHKHRPHYPLERRRLKCRPLSCPLHYRRRLSTLHRPRATNPPFWLHLSRRWSNGYERALISSWIPPSSLLRSAAIPTVAFNAASTRSHQFAFLAAFPQAVQSVFYARKSPIPPDSLVLARIKPSLTSPPKPSLTRLARCK